MPAAFVLSATVEGVPETKVALARFSLVSLNRVRQVIAASALAIQNEARRNCAVDTGRTRDSIRVRYGGVPERTEATIGSDTLPAVFLEFGTRPHPTAKSQAPRAMPPPGVLLDWMRRHGIDESAEFALRRHIKLHGTAARPFLFPAYEAERPRFEAKLQAALNLAVTEAGGAA